MEFQALKLEHITQLRPYFEKNKCRICDCTIGGSFIWRDTFKTEFAIEEGLLYLKVKYLTGETAFTPPRGEPCPEKEAYDRIVDYCRQNGLIPRLCVVSEHRLEQVKLSYPDAEITTNRNWFDYLYQSEDIKNLSGRRYSGQRNHINRFQRENPDWSFEIINPENLKEVRAFFETYAQEHHRDSETYEEGNRKALEVLDNLDIYKLFGGFLTAGGKVVGASLGEIVGDTLFVHVEKSLTAYAGSYPMVVNQFAKAFAGEGVTYINREEDDGIEGLRTSKLSYHPCALLEKYIVTLK
ncbi:DUF2156 domain-containing protein [Oscillospiraceae bacterium CM]|nr:DUF2156 domain-containing protein [Oscillospiraceae bacterium CM]